MMLSLELLGGIGLFLLGMSMLTDGLKMAAGDGLRTILQRWTRTPLRGFASGALLTGVVQSSSAVTVATIGFVNAGLLTLSHAVWVIFGANVGTTGTAWLVALVGLKLDIGAFALPFIGLGVVMNLFSDRRPRLGGIGQAITGFGLFFLGIDILKDGFETLLPWFESLDLSGVGPLAPFAFLLFGIVLAALTQSSSAAIAIILTATAGGGLPIQMAAAGIIGANIGTTTTAIFASAGATPAAKRVALSHIVFSLFSGTVAFILLYPLTALSDVLADLLITGEADTPLTLAVFNTLFNTLGVILIWPISGWLIAWLQKRYVSTEEEIGRPSHLDPTLAAVPDVALRGLVLEIQRMMNLAFQRASDRIAGGPRTADTNSDTGILTLGQAIRDFIADLSRKPLSSDVVAALPDLIRSVHHVEETLTEGAALLKETPPAHLISGPGWERLRTGVLATFETTAEDTETFKIEFDRERQEVDAAYEAIKRDLLARTASGQISVHMMENCLLRARRMRRLAEAALKAERRLQPWAPLGMHKVETAAPAED